MGLATPRPSETWCLRVCSLDQTLVQTAGDHSPPAPAPRRTDVRIGSLADISERTSDVCFTTESGHAQPQHRCPLCANSGLRLPPNLRHSWRHPLDFSVAKTGNLFFVPSATFLENVGREVS